AGQITLDQRAQISRIILRLGVGALAELAALRRIALELSAPRKNPRAQTGIGDRSVGLWPMSLFFAPWCEHLLRIENLIQDLFTVFDTDALDHLACERLGLRSFVIERRDAIGQRAVDIDAR